MAGALPKPLLRGQLNRNIAKSLIIATVVSFAIGGAFKVLYADPKKERYANFYKNYDPVADWRRMRDLGLLQSAQPGEGD